MRAYKTIRKTKETEIHVFINIDGSGNFKINLEQKFLKHMLETFSFYSCFDIEIEAKGDLKHHIVEDIAIVLGNAFNNALGDKSGINRFGYSIIPMDDSLVLTSVDISGRGYFNTNYEIRNVMIEDISDELLIHFLRTFALNSRINLHVICLNYSDLHHLFEAIFKSLAISLKEACKIVDRKTPSIKGEI